MTDTRKLVTAKVVAEHLGLATSTVLRLGREGVLPSHILGTQQRPVRFRISECEAAFAARGAETDTDRPQLREVGR